MEVKASRIVGWEHVLNSARATVGKKELNKDPSEDFKSKMLVCEHSPIRSLLYEIIWENIPYWVSMHIRTHHIGFKSGEDDLYFIETQRTDRTQKLRDKLPQDAPVMLRCQTNAQALINVSRVRLCRTAMAETVEAWQAAVKAVAKIDSAFAALCVPNCIYRGFCCEPNTCGYYKTKAYQKALQKYRDFTNVVRSSK